MNVCKCCKLPQPEKGSLHLETCPLHNMNTCIVCKTLLKEEDYEELATVQQARIRTENIQTKEK